ncbi:MAG: hypothetical protein AB1640_23740 [bacterium]
MSMEFLATRKKPKEWMITWSENKLRWVLFYYLVGLIVSCLVFFAEETCFPVPGSYLSKSLCVTVVIPLITVVASILGARNGKD